MARRGKTSPAEDLMDIMAMLPWWVGVMLALVGYLLLHSVASQQVVATAQPGQVGAMVTQTLWKTLASVGQYILPILCLGGAGMSAWRRRARQSLVTDVAQSKATDALDGMSWREFEMLVGEGFRLQGYQVVETGGGGADGGVDLVLTKPGKNGGEKFLVQCKQWRAFKVGVDVVRELYGVMAARGATGGFVVTSGRFTDEAISFASGRNVNLVDGPKLHGLIRQAKAGIDRSPAKSAAAAAPAVPPSAAPMQASSCPLCSKPMVRRTAKLLRSLRLAQGKLCEDHDLHALLGLKRPAPRIRVRLLCPTLRRHVGGLEDFELPVAQLAALDIAPRTVLIVENLDTGLALPDMAGTVAVMRLGAAVKLVAELPWITRADCLYWGDIDTFGFEILHRARCVVPHLRSVLMDSTTLLEYRSLWVNEQIQTTGLELPLLTIDEREVFDGLRTNRWGESLRLEQERIPWTMAMNVLFAATGSAGTA